jgi:hypothetical protein
MPTRTLAAASALLCAAGLAQADLIVFNFPLTPQQEVPPNNSNAAGAASLVYDTVTQTFDLDLQVFGIPLNQLAQAGANNTPVHIHLAPPGVNGGIVIDLGLHGSFVNQGLGINLSLTNVPIGGPQGNLPPSNPAVNEAALFAGELYINVHTLTYPAGQIRGQIIPAPGASLLALGGLALAFRRRR